MRFHFGQLVLIFGQYSYSIIFSSAKRNFQLDRAVDDTPSQIPTLSPDYKMGQTYKCEKIHRTTDDVSKTLQGEGQNAASDLGLHCLLSLRI